MVPVLEGLVNLVGRRSRDIGTDSYRMGVWVDWLVSNKFGL